MKVGINLLYLIPGLVGGTETYAAGLLRGLSALTPEDEFVIFVNQEAGNWPLPDTPHFKRVVCPVRAVNRGRRYFFEQFRLPGLLKEYGVELVHSLGYVSPLHAPCPAVVTILDLNYRALGIQMAEGRRRVLAFVVKQSALRAKRVITISKFAQREIAETFHLPDGRVVVTYLAPHPRAGSGAAIDGAPVQALLRLRVQPPYVMAFSGRSPHKNISRLVSAFARAREQHNLPHQLVVVGHHPPDWTNISETPMVRDNIIVFTGYLDDCVVETVLSGAQVLVFPSVYEGFGLPVLEAMRAGVAVVCSNQASLPEVAGSAAVFFNPYSVEEMARAIAEVALSPELRDELKRKGHENLKRFSWEATARGTLEVYRGAVA